MIADRCSIIDPAINVEQVFEERNHTLYETAVACQFDSGGNGLPVCIGERIACRVNHICRHVALAGTIGIDGAAFCVFCRREFQPLAVVDPFN